MKSNLLVAQLHLVLAAAWLAAVAWGVDKPTVALVTRTYHKDKENVVALEATIRMFVPRNIPWIVVLDDEKPEDHLFGRWLANRGRATVRYEPLPGGDIFRSGEDSAWGQSERYNRVGYNRQCWSQFYLDNWTDANIIGALDADARFYGVLTDDMISLGDGKILARGMMNDHFPGDKLALNFSISIDFMWVNVFPMFYWRSTFAVARQAVEAAWGLPFDKAYYEFSREPYSPQNILYQVGLKHEPGRYDVRMANNRRKPTLQCGSDRRVHEMDMMLGCCTSFAVNCKCPKYEILWRAAVLQYGTIKTLWQHEIWRAEQYYNRVRKILLPRMNQSDVKLMRRHCRMAYWWGCVDVVKAPVPVFR
eukprot:TRINITY_DN50858_c0_g1_i1.p1 TRINITY_DN50858_c0_g1~~TRINITY_DN50858_c0_g1_i1.p1  ORF type:complete len:363 (+),score=51.54 TRINITY_DN50858_c0_g1_i1:151-1239(+)